MHFSPEKKLIFTNHYLNPVVSVLCSRLTKTVRNFQISLVQGTRENPSSAAAAMPKAKLPAQLKSAKVFFFM